MVNSNSTESFRASYRSIPMEKEKFKKSSCLLTISVGQEVHEGEKFKATIDLVNNTFNECVMLVDDTLQRHTLRLNEPSLGDEEAYNLSLIEGDIWLQRNAKHYNMFNIPFSFKRWDNWLFHKDFNEKLKIIENEINNNICYKYSFDNTIIQFLNRYNKRLENINHDENFGYNLCMQYLKEECSIMLLWVNDGYNYEVYPSRRNEAMKATHDIFIKPYVNGILESVSLKFHKKKNNKTDILLKRNDIYTNSFVVIDNVFEKNTEKAIA